MLSYSADQRTTCCKHSLNRNPDTPAPEKDFGGASGQRGASIKVPGSAQLVWSCNNFEYALTA